MNTSRMVNRTLNGPGVLGIAALLVSACSTPAPPVTPEQPPPTKVEELAPPPKVEEPSPPPAPVATEPLKVPGPLTFATGSDRLNPESDAALTHLKEYLGQKTQVTRIRIEGHTDSAGARSANQKLSEGRALSVAGWLVNHGVDCKRLLAVGFGDSKPIADNTSAEGRAQNRRTMFINAEVDGKQLGGAPLDGGGVVAGDSCNH